MLCLEQSLDPISYENIGSSPLSCHDWPFLVLLNSLRPQRIHCQSGYKKFDIWIPCAIKLKPTSRLCSKCRTLDHICIITPECLKLLHIQQKKMQTRFQSLFLSHLLCKALPSCLHTTHGNPINYKLVIVIYLQVHKMPARLVSAILHEFWGVNISHLFRWGFSVVCRPRICINSGIR